MKFEDRKNFFTGLTILALMFIIMILGAINNRPRILIVKKIDSSPESVLWGDPNLKVLPSWKRISQYEYLIISEEVNSDKYFKKNRQDTAIITMTDRKLAPEGRVSYIFSDDPPEKIFLD